jgi:DNA-binding transcriptional LysR family regulator
VFFSGCEDFVNGLVTRLLSNQVAEHVRAGRLQLVLSSEEPPPIPIHIIPLDGRLSVPKVRAFMDFVVPRLRAQFAQLAVSART